MHVQGCTVHGCTMHACLQRFASIHPISCKALIFYEVCVCVWGGGEHELLNHVNGVCQFKCFPSLASQHGGPLRQDAKAVTLHPPRTINSNFT